MRATGTTMISRDSIVYPTMEGGSKGKIKEGSPRRSPGERRFSSKQWRGDRAVRSLAPPSGLCLYWLTVNYED